MGVVPSWFVPYPFLQSTIALSQAGAVIMDSIPQSEASNDIFSLSDELLSEHIQFIDEVGTRLIIACFYSN